MAPPPATRPERLRKLRRSMVAARMPAGWATWASAVDAKFRAISEVTPARDDLAFLVSMFRLRSDPRRAVVIADVTGFGITAARLFLAGGDGCRCFLTAGTDRYRGDCPRRADPGCQQEAATLQILGLLLFHFPLRSKS